MPNKDPLAIEKPLPKVVIRGKDGCVVADVVLQSANKHSLAVRFDGFILGGYAGMMPLAWDEARQCYTDLLFGHEFHVKWLAND